MKLNLSAVALIIAFSSARAFAQFVPAPPVVYIPQLDPLRMLLEQNLMRANTNAATPNGRRAGGRKTPTNSAAATTPKTVESVTAFTPQSERILPARLSQASGKNNADATRRAREMFDAFLDRYHSVALTDGFPPNDLAYALEFFVVNNYIIYNDLYDLSPQDKALMTPGGDPLLALQRRFGKQAQTVTAAAEKAVYGQMKATLEANAAVAKLTDAQKQEFTEMLAIITMVNFRAYQSAAQTKNADAFAESQNTARQALEKMLGAPAEKIKITDKGLEF